MKLQDKVALITGGGGDLASATAKLFLQEGAKVVLTVSKEEKVSSTRARYDADQSVEVVKADVRILEDMENAAAFAVQTFGRLDILVTCAGAIRHGQIDEMTMDDWNQIVDVNLTGTFCACKAVVPIMKRQHYGKIVNVSSIAGRTGRPGNGVNYAASKAGVDGITRLLATQLAKYNITVNGIAPGPMRGKMFDSMPPERQALSNSNVPLGRIGELDEVAYGILYMSSDDSSWTTGAILDINGGLFT